MNRKLKISGLVLIAVVAVGAIAASAVWGETEAEWEAQGNPKRFRAGAAPALVTGTSEIATFTFNAGSVKCGVHYEGTMKGQLEPELKITPTYTGCSGFGFSTVDVKMSGCYYLFTLEPGTTVTPGPPETTHTTGPMHIKCPAGQSILLEATAFGLTVCTATVHEQTPQNIVDTRNENIGAGKTEDVLFTSTLENIEYGIHNSGGNCGVEKTQFDGKLEGSVTVKAFEDKVGGAQVSFKIVGK